MGGVGGVGSGGSTENVSNQSQAQSTDQAQELQKLQSSQIENQTAQSNDQQRQLLGQQNASQELMQQMQMQAMRLQSNQNAFDSAPPEVKTAANNISAMVMKQLRSSMGQMQQQQDPTGAGGIGGGGEGEGAQNQSSGGPGTLSANMFGMGGGSNPSLEASDARIQDAAKVAVYRDIVGMLNGMNDKRMVKDNLRQAESTLNAVLARAKPGDKVRIPVFEFDEKTGKVSQKGVKEMSYEEAVNQRDALRDKRDSISEMNEMDMLQLQQMMERKGQLESMISNCMKAGYEGGQAAVQALKAS
jgi:hypothetical protein